MMKTAYVAAGFALALSGVALERFQALGCSASHLTLAHDAGVAVACVVIEG